MIALLKIVRKLALKEAAEIELKVNLNDTE